MERVNVMREALLFKKELMEFYIEFSNKDPFQQDEIMQKILAVTKENTAEFLLLHCRHFERKVWLERKDIGSGNFQTDTFW